MNLEAITKSTPVVVEPGDVIAHIIGCPDASGTEQLWGSGFWPAGCCIDVDVIPQRTESVEMHFARNRGNGTGTGKSSRVPTATAKQIAYIEKLMAERRMSEEQALAVADTQGDYSELAQLPKPTASKLIDALLSQPLGGDGQPAMSTDEVEQWLAALGRKVEIDDVTPRLREAAIEWAKAYRGNFGFMRDQRRNASTKGLTVAQAKAVLNCWRADVQRIRPTAETTKATGLDLSDLPAGRYAVPDGDTRLKVLVQKPEEGRWEGWTFVKDAAQYGEGKRYGTARPGGLYSGDIAEQLAAIAADPKAASIAYGKLVGRCGRCNRALEDEASVAAGIGPVCATKF